MGAQQRVFKQKIRSTQSLRKIFKAMELIAASRIQKAIARSQAASPYANALTRAVSAVASESNVDHVLTTESDNVKHAAVLVIGPDRGFAGAYSANLLREAEELIRLLHNEGKSVDLFTVGGKAKNYYTFRDRKIEKSWTGISENPLAEHAREIGEALLENFDPESDDSGIDEIYIVFTRFVSSVTHDPEYRRLLPLEVVDAEEAIDRRTGRQVRPMHPRSRSMSSNRVRRLCSTHCCRDTSIRASCRRCSAQQPPSRPRDRRR
jgi:F-type H+-transporting ATPase subunit gamma